MALAWVTFALWGWILSRTLFGGIISAFVAVILLSLSRILHETSHALVGIHFGKKIDHIYFGGFGAYVLFLKPEKVIPLWQDILISLAGIIVNIISIMLMSALALLALALGSSLVAILFASLAFIELLTNLYDLVSGDGKDIRKILSWLKATRKALKQSKIEIGIANRALKNNPSVRGAERLKCVHMDDIRTAQRLIRFVMPYLPKAEVVMLEKRIKLYDKWLNGL